MTWLNWFMPGLFVTFLAAVVGGVRELFKLWNACSVAAQEFKSYQALQSQAEKQIRDDLGEEKRRNDAQDIRLGVQDTTLGRIDENVKAIKEAVAAAAIAIQAQVAVLSNRTKDKE